MATYKWLHERLTIDDTRLEFWQERDRLYVALLRKAKDTTMIEWWDSEVEAAVDEGILDWAESVLGNMSRFVNQGGALHRSAFAYWRGRNQTRKQRREARNIA